MDHQRRPRLSLAAALVRSSVRRRLMPRDRAERRAMLENLDALRMGELVLWFWENGEVGSYRFTCPRQSR